MGTSFESINYLTTLLVWKERPHTLENKQTKILKRKGRREGEREEEWGGEKTKFSLVKVSRVKKNVKLVWNLQGTNNWLDTTFLLDSWF